MKNTNRMMWLRTAPLLCLLLTFGQELSAQLSIERELVGATVAICSDGSSDQLRVEASFGEPIIGFAAGDVIVSSGFHQTFLENPDNIGQPDNDEITEEIGVVAYPNPVRDWLSIDLGSQKDRFEELQVVDLYGRILVKKDPDSNQVIELNDVSELPGATYYLYGIDEEGNRIGLATIAVVKF